MTTALAPNLSTLAQRINDAHQRCELSLRGGLEAAIEAGELLAEVKRSLEHGKWLSWVKTNFEGSHDTASLYVRIARQCKQLPSNFERVRNMSLRSAAKYLTKREHSAGRTNGHPRQLPPPTVTVTTLAPEPECDVADVEIVDADVVDAEVTVISAFKESDEAESLEALAADARKFSCIYADPPWRYGNQATRASTDNHYPTMTVEEIAALPVGELADDRCHLWLWTTNGFLFECPKLFDAWGFEFKSSYIWCKSQMGIGNYLRNAHEFLLLAVRGGLTAAARDVRSWGEFPRGQHSAKPEQIRTNVIERISPAPRLELFGRVRSHGWTVWGNQIGKDLFDASGSV